MLNFDDQPPCHNNDQVSEQWRKYEARIGVRWIKDRRCVCDV